MKKQYTTPEIELSKFSLDTDILNTSGLELDLPAGDSVIDSGSGFNW